MQSQAILAGTGQVYNGDRLLSGVHYVIPPAIAGLPGGWRGSLKVIEGRSDLTGCKRLTLRLENGSQAVFGLTKSNLITREYEIRVEALRI